MLAILAAPAQIIDGRLPRSQKCVGHMNYHSVRKYGPQDEQVHTSILLERLIADAPKDHFTLEWLTGKLPRHSFGFILLFLSVIALLPVISVVARILIIVLTGQIILGYHDPMLPGRLLKKQLPSKYLVRLRHHVVPALRRLEYFVRPRWVIMLKGTRRLTALVGMMGMILSLPAPIPFINMPPAAIGMLISLSYIEHDGLMLFFALCAAFAFLGSISFVLLEPFFR